jgi:hypothetical protein
MTFPQDRRDPKHFFTCLRHLYIQMNTFMGCLFKNRPILYCIGTLQNVYSRNVYQQKYKHKIYRYSTHKTYTHAAHTITKRILYQTLYFYDIGFQYFVQPVLHCKSGKKPHHFGRNGADTHSTHKK